MGQNTGTSKNSKNVIESAISVARKHEYQNLNSGNLLAKGLYESCGVKEKVKK